MSIFAIADLHLSLGTDKPMDIFSGWENYVEKLEKNWRNLVKEEDTVVIAGDISWAMKLENSVEDFKFINDLPGKKLLIKGNHDYWWSTKRKIDQFFFDNDFNTLEIVHNSCKAVENIAICGTRGWSYDAGVQDQKIVLREAGRLRASLQQAQQTGCEPIVFLHYPPVLGDYKSEEIVAVLNEFEIKKVYYGHLHGHAHRRAVNGYHEGINYRLIACDYTGFWPVPVK